MQKTITIAMDHGLDRKHGRTPLGELMEEVLDLVNPNRETWGETTTANWIARQAIRAVCEAILKRGALPAPISVELKMSPGGMELPFGKSDRFDGHGRN